MLAGKRYHYKDRHSFCLHCETENLAHVIFFFFLISPFLFIVCTANIAKKNNWEVHDPVLEQVHRWLAESHTRQQEKEENESVRLKDNGKGMK